MMGSEARILSPGETLEPLMTQYIEVEKELEETGSRRRRQHLKRELDDLRVELGWTLMDCGKPEDGLALYRLLSWTSHGEIKCNGMSRALTEMKYYDEARRLLEAGLRRFPNSYQLWVALGALNDVLGDPVGVLKCCDMAILCAPEGSWEARYNKVITLEKLGSYEEATEILDGLIHKYPEDPKYLAERGYCASQTGYPQDALQYYQRAMEFWAKKPCACTGVSIYAGLCSAYFDMGEKKKAMEIALEGLKRFPGEDPILYQNVGATFWEMGWKQEAREVLKKGLEKFPEDEDLKKFFSDVDADMDDPDGGIKPPILGLILLTALIHKKMRGRRP